MSTFRYTSQYHKQLRQQKTFKEVMEGYGFNEQEYREKQAKRKDIHGTKKH